MEKLKKLKLYLLDMDGTIYLDNELFDGTLDLLEHIKSIGGRYMFLTNNSSRGVSEYIKKLHNMGIDSDKDDFVTSVDATIDYLRSKDYKKIYVFGTNAMKNQLKEEGFPITEQREDGIDLLLIGYDTELTFKKLEDACILLNKGVDYVATNPDWVCPTWYGFVPDCGSVSEMLFNATKRRPKFIGKPNPEMLYLAMKKTGFTKDETVIIGDRLYTDIASGVNAGALSIFVLSGEGTLKDLETSDVKPTYVFKNVRELYENLIN